MGIQTIPAASGGLAVSDLITSPKWTQIGSFTTSNSVSTQTFSSLSGYKRYAIAAVGITSNTVNHDFHRVRVNGVSTESYFLLTFSGSSLSSGTGSGSNDGWVISGYDGNNQVPSFWWLEIGNGQDSGPKKGTISVVGRTNNGASQNLQRGDIIFGIGTNPGSITSLSVAMNGGNNISFNTTLPGYGLYVFGGN